MIKPEVINLFPLTIYKSRIELSNIQKKEMIEEILKMKSTSNRPEYHSSGENTWTGDTQGYGDLFDNKKFNFFFDEVAKIIKDYLAQFHINSEELDCYFQRAWATISNNKENIKVHTHAQSHLSFAFYLIKSSEDSNIQFVDDYKHNEFIPKLFTSKTVANSDLFKKRDLNNEAFVDINCKEGDIVIFPSKTFHQTQQEKINKQRISISADISFVSKNSGNLEHLMPPLNKWKKI